MTENNDRTINNSEQIELTTGEIPPKQLTYVKREKTSYSIYIIIALISSIVGIFSDLSLCELIKTNLSRTILYEANLKGADLKAVRLFYGNYKTASPRSRTDEPNYKTGEYTGVVIEKANLTGVKNLSEENRYYCCCWGGEYTRSTIPGGCQGIPDRSTQD